MLDEFQIDKIKFRSLRLCRRPRQPNPRWGGKRLSWLLLAPILAHLGALDGHLADLVRHLDAKSPPR